MNKLSIHLLLLLIALYVGAVRVHAQDDTQHPKIELAIVDVFWGANKILITHPDERTETINFNLTGKGDDRVFAQDRVILSVLQRFYDAGWTIESEIFLPSGLRAVYVLKRKVR